MDVLTGLDSLLIPAAQWRDVPSVMMAGSNDPRRAQATLGRLARTSGGCPRPPCYNRPRGERTPGQYDCLRSLEPARVLEETVTSWPRAAPEASARRP